MWSRSFVLFILFIRVTFASLGFSQDAALGTIRGDRR